MSLSQALMIASQSLGTISSQIGVVSRNISNAGVEGATKKTSLVITGANGGAEFTGIRREKMKRFSESCYPPMQQVAPANEFRMRLIK
jgi:flagellar hook-associated protein FlgK